MDVDTEINGVLKSLLVMAKVVYEALCLVVCPKSSFGSSQVNIQLTNPSIADKFKFYVFPEIR